MSNVTTPAHTNSDIRFLYLRDSVSSRVVTIARRVYKTDPNGTRWIEFAYAVNKPVVKRDGWVVSSGDYFNKTTGRKIAVARLNMGKSMLTFTSEREGPIEAVLKFLTTCDDSFNVPKSVRDLAKEALASSQGIPNTSTINNTTNDKSSNRVSYDF